MEFVHLNQKNSANRLQNFFTGFLIVAFQALGFACPAQLPDYNVQVLIESNGIQS